MDGTEAVLIALLICVICDIILLYVAEILQHLLILSLLDEEF